MDSASVLWLVIIVLAAVLEGATAQLVSIWAVVGGIAALIASMCGAPFWLQCLLFVVVTGVTLAVSWPLVRKGMKMKKEDTNAGRYVGKTGIVTEEVNNIEAHGQVRVMGSIWTARTKDGAVLPVGTGVFVECIEGVKLIVRESRSA